MVQEHLERAVIDPAEDGKVMKWRMVEASLCSLRQGRAAVLKPKTKTSQQVMTIDSAGRLVESRRLGSDKNERRKRRRWRFVSICGLALGRADEFCDECGAPSDVASATSVEPVPPTVLDPPTPMAGPSDSPIEPVQPPDRLIA
jgi:hypothetical protein